MEQLERKLFVLKKRGASWMGGGQEERNEKARKEGIKGVGKKERGHEKER